MAMVGWHRKSRYNKPMTVRSELKKLVDLETYNQNKVDGGLHVVATTTEGNRVELTFDKAAVDNWGDDAIALFIADHFSVE